ncbi:MAG: HEPN domain-containing protein [Candidatus Aminicenantes bacterium]|nr:HEPN domain-containing protein [Candidatus Aminicenantes bacterium]
MNKKDSIWYWLESAKEDWKVAKHLFEKRDYSYSLFLGHLTIEKILKAIYVDRLNDTPPYTHRLIHLSEKASLELTDEQIELLEAITDFNLEARYPDEKFSFKKKCTRSFTENYLKKIEGMRKWLLRLVQH